MPQKTDIHQMKGSPLDVLLIYQGEAAANARDFIVHFLKDVLSPGDVRVRCVSDGAADLSETPLSNLKRLVESCDAAIAILADDLRPASTAGNLWFEVGLWLGLKSPDTIMLLDYSPRCNGGEEIRALSALQGSVIPIYELSSELTTHLYRFTVKLQAASSASLSDESLAPPAAVSDSDRRRKMVFISYSHDDVEWLKRVQKHLKPLQRKGLIDPWTDTRIEAGSKWKREIKNAIASARVAILLISASYLASEFIMEDELPPLLVAAENEGTRVLPLIIKPCGFLSEEQLSRFQAINDPAIPLLGQSEYDQEEALVRLSEAVADAFQK